MGATRRRRRGGRASGDDADDWAPERARLWTREALAPGPDQSSLVDHVVGSAPAATLAVGLAGALHTPFTRAAQSAKPTR
jgi:hypothetical protein